MNFSTKDKEAYKLTKLLQTFGDEKNSDFLYDYWVKTNKLKFLPAFLSGRNAMPSVIVDEIQYVVVLENLLEIFTNDLQSFLNKYCSEESVSLTMGATTTEASKDLIDKLSKLKKLSFNAGWATLYEDLNTLLASLTVAMDKLIAYDKTGKHIHFVTNVTADEILSSVEVDFERRAGKYFILNRK